MHELDGMTIVDDAYNANPASMTAAIDALSRTHEGRRIFVMGDMLELGDDSARFHQRVLQEAIDLGIEVIVPVGVLMGEAALRVTSVPKGQPTFCCQDAELAQGVLTAIIAPGDTIWIKGSRGVGLDRVVHELRKRFGQQVAVA